MSVYDSDDAIPKSPGLEPIPSKNYIPDSSVPLELLENATSSSSEIADSSTSRNIKKHKKRKRKRNQVEEILIHYIDPNQPEIAQHDSNSGSSTPEPVPRKGLKMDRDVRIAQPPAPHYSDLRSRRVSLPKQTLAKLAQGPPTMMSKAFINNSPRLHKQDMTKEAPKKFEFPDPSTRRGSRSRTRAELERQKSSQQKVPTLSSLDLRGKRPRPTTNNSYTRPTFIRRKEPSSSVSSSGSIATSPKLQPHLILDAQAPDELKLAPLTSENRADKSPIPSLRHELSLPAVGAQKHTLSSPQNRPRNTSHSSNDTSKSGSPPRRTQTVHRFLSPFGEVPYRFSPSASAYETRSPSVASTLYCPQPGQYEQSRLLYQHQRDGPQRPRAVTLPTRYSSSGRSSTGPTSVPSMSVDRSTSTEDCTPSSMPTPSDRQTSIETNHSAPSSYVQYPSVPIGGYRCDFEGCDAAPFSTLYLLNSHANVHSQERPHFCDIEGCPRSKAGKDGKGGKGFKRKNEMIRHGLVHESPGYICPFCPDKEHKYPRPDNLQRHVRMHHDDKDKDDPMLREILTKRGTATAQTRGRKKRP